MRRLDEVVHLPLNRAEGAGCREGAGHIRGVERARLDAHIEQQHLVFAAPGRRSAPSAASVHARRCRRSSSSRGRCHRCERAGRRCPATSAHLRRRSACRSSREHAGEAVDGGVDRLAQLGDLPVVLHDPEFRELRPSSDATRRAFHEQGGRRSRAAAPASIGSFARRGQTQGAERLHGQSQRRRPLASCPAAEPTQSSPCAGSAKNPGSPGGRCGQVRRSRRGSRTLGYITRRRLPRRIRSAREVAVGAGSRRSVSLLRIGARPRGTMSVAAGQHGAQPFAVRRAADAAPGSTARCGRVCPSRCPCSRRSRAASAKRGSRGSGAVGAAWMRSRAPVACCVSLSCAGSTHL